MDAQEWAIKHMLKSQQRGMEFSKEQFDAAMGELKNVGPAMRTELLAREKQSISADQQSALGTGLTGMETGRLRASRSDMQRNLAGLEENLAGARAGLQANRANAIYSQYLDRANIRQRTKYDPFLENWNPAGMVQMGAQSGAALGNALGGGDVDMAQFLALLGL